MPTTPAGVARICGRKESVQRRVAERCFASPGACGYPDPAYKNVGVPAGMTLKPSGSISVLTNGAVIKGMDVTGTISVRADNVTIESSRITCEKCAGSFVIYEPNGYSGLTIKDSEISGGNTYVGGGAGGINSLQRVYMWNCDECVQYDVNVTDSYFYVGQPVSGAHYEAFYNGDGTTNIQHSTILNPHTQTAAVFMNTAGGARWSLPEPPHDQQQPAGRRRVPGLPVRERRLGRFERDCDHEQSVRPMHLPACSAGRGRENLSGLRQPVRRR